jgi:type IV secretion system protein VirB4
VVLATQSLSDAVRSGIFDVLIESCPTKILLPNEEAAMSGFGDIPGPREIYAAFGLNEAEIELIRNAAKKRHYYAISPDGRRLFELGLGRVALSFLAAGSKDQIADIKSLQAAHGADWTSFWLDKNGVSHAHRS